MMKRKVAFLLLHPAMTKKNATGDCLKSSGGERLAVCDLAFCFMPDNSSSVKDILTSPSVKKKKKKVRGQPQISAPRRAACCMRLSAVLKAASCDSQHHFQTASVLSFLLRITQTYKYSKHDCGFLCRIEMMVWYESLHARISSLFFQPPLVAIIVAAALFFFFFRLPLLASLKPNSFIICLPSFWFI